MVCRNTLFFALEDVGTRKRRHIKVAHDTYFEAEQVKEQLGLIDKAWSGFVEQVRKMAGHQMEPETATSFFEALFLQGESRRLSNKAQREYEAIIGLFRSAPGQEIDSAKGTLWGAVNAVNAVSYYADHVRAGTTGERLNSAWFGSGSALKERAWHQALSIIS